LLARMCDALLMQLLGPRQIRWRCPIMTSIRHGAREQCMTAMLHANRKSPARIVFHVEARLRSFHPKIVFGASCTKAIAMVFAP
jgi:hypothetical protein